MKNAQTLNPKINVLLIQIYNINVNLIQTDHILVKQLIFPGVFYSSIKTHFFGMCSGCSIFCNMTKLDQFICAYSCTSMACIGVWVKKNRCTKLKMNQILFCCEQESWFKRYNHNTHNHSNQIVTPKDNSNFHCIIQHGLYTTITVTF